MIYQQTILLNDLMDSDGVRCAFRDIAKEMLTRAEEGARMGRPVYLGLKSFNVDPKTARKALRWVVDRGMIAMKDAVGWKRKAEAVPGVNWKNVYKWRDEGRAKTKGRHVGGSDVGILEEAGCVS